METATTAVAQEPAATAEARDPIVIDAIDKMGGCTKAAKDLTAWAKGKGLKQKVGKTSISMWTRIPDRWVRGVHELSGFALKKLRPDLYDAQYKVATIP